MQVTIKNLRNKEQTTFGMPYYLAYDLNTVLNPIGIEVDEYDDFYIGDEEVEQGKDYEVSADFSDENLKEKDLPRTLQELEELAEFLQDASEEEKDVFLTMLNDMGKCVDDAMHDVRHNNYIYYDCCSDYSLGEQYVNNVLGSLSELPRETLERYFDFEAFGKDLAMDFYQTNNGCYLEEL